MTPPSQDRTGLPERLAVDAEGLIRDNLSDKAFKPCGPHREALAAELVRRYNEYGRLVELANELAKNAECFCGEPRTPCDTCKTKAELAALSAGIGQGE